LRCPENRDKLRFARERPCSSTRLAEDDAMPQAGVRPTGGRKCTDSVTGTSPFQKRCEGTRPAGAEARDSGMWQGLRQVPNGPRDGHRIDPGTAAAGTGVDPRKRRRLSGHRPRSGGRRRPRASRAALKNIFEGVAGSHGAEPDAWHRGVVRRLRRPPSRSPSGAARRSARRAAWQGFAMGEHAPARVKQAVCGLRPARQGAGCSGW